MAVLAHLVTWMVIAAAAGAPPRDQQAIEFEVRAVYLFNFARFVEWPASAFADTGAPIRICIAGDDPLGTALDRAVVNERVQERRIQAVRLGGSGSARGCHILYVPPSEQRRAPAIIGSLGGQPTLTVGEGAQFLSRGGMIGFRRVENRVRFDVNLDAAQKTGLRVSARLLSVAADVRKAGR